MASNLESRLRMSPQMLYSVEHVVAVLLSATSLQSEGSESCCQLKEKHKYAFLHPVKTYRLHIRFFLFIYKNEKVSSTVVV